MALSDEQLKFALRDIARIKREARELLQKRVNCLKYDQLNSFVVLASIKMQELLGVIEYLESDKAKAERSSENVK